MRFLPLKRENAKKRNFWKEFQYFMENNNMRIERKKCEKSDIKEAEKAKVRIEIIIFFDILMFNPHIGLKVSVQF